MPLKAEQTAPTFPRKEIPAASRKVEKKIRVSIVFKIGCFPLPFPSVREKFGRFCGKDRAEKVYSHAFFRYVSGVYGRKGNGKRFDIKISLLRRLRESDLAVRCARFASNDSRSTPHDPTAIPVKITGSGVREAPEGYCQRYPAACFCRLS